jgi:hypothetical protein
MTADAKKKKKKILVKTDAQYFYDTRLFSTDHSSGDKHLLTLISTYITEEK